MCDFISLFHNPLNGDIEVADLNSHSVTEQQLKLNKAIWREGHYRPNGSVELRVESTDRQTQQECEDRFLARFPKFTDFFNWCLKETNQENIFRGSLDLRGLTSAKGLTLPKKVGGSLDLVGLTSAKGLTLPKKVGGYLDLRGLTSAKGLTLPKKVGGYLDLRGLTSAKGLTLPKKVGGYLYLRGLTSAKDLTL